MGRSTRDSFKYGCAHAGACRSTQVSFWSLKSAGGTGGVSLDGKLDKERASVQRSTVFGEAAAGDANARSRVHWRVNGPLVALTPRLKALITRSKLAIAYWLRSHNCERFVILACVAKRKMEPSAKMLSGICADALVHDILPFGTYSHAFSVPPRVRVISRGRFAPGRTLLRAASQLHVLPVDSGGPTCPHVPSPHPQRTNAVLLSLRRALREMPRAAIPAVIPHSQTPSRPCGVAVVV
jgi:hypothetical protein